MTMEELENSIIEFNVRKIVTISLEDVCNNARLNYEEIVNMLLDLRKEGKSLMHVNIELYYIIVDSLTELVHCTDIRECYGYIDTGFTEGCEELNGTNILEIFEHEEI